MKNMTATIARPLLADSSTGRINATCNQSLQLHISALCYNNQTQHHYDSIILRGV
jgi:hypothetical protein